MGFTKDVRILTENLYIFKGYGARKKLLEKLYETPARQQEEAAADDLKLRGDTIMSTQYIHTYM